MFRGRTLWIVAFLAALLWSVYRPFDYTIWLLEVFPALIAAVVLWFTRDRFPLTRLAYVLILLHCIILMVGGHYTYAEVPLGDWFAEWTGGGLVTDPVMLVTFYGALAEGRVVSADSETNRFPQTLSSSSSLVTTRSRCSSR